VIFLINLKAFMNLLNTKIYNPIIIDTNTYLYNPILVILPTI